MQLQLLFRWCARGLELTHHSLIIAIDLLLVVLYALHFLPNRLNAEVSHVLASLIRRHITRRPIHIRVQVELLEQTGHREVVRLFLLAQLGSDRVLLLL